MNAEDAERRDALAERVFTQCIGFMDIMAIYLGDRLGFYATMADGAPITARTLAERTATDERYAREWLEHQAVGGILDVATDDTEGRTFVLPAGHREALADETSLAFVAPLAQQMVGFTKPLDALVDAYRTGTGVPYEAYGEDVRAGIERGNRPQFHHELATTWIPAMPDIEIRLQREPPARIADFGCGSGWSSIALATAYPHAIVHGLDVDAESIVAARANGAHLADRLVFSEQDAGAADLAGSYDLVCAFECIHDMADPVAALRVMHRLAGPGGTVLVGDERVAETFTAPGDDLERIMYGFSVVHCLPVGTADQPTAATGTVMRRSLFERYAREAGFQVVEVLPVENVFWQFYRLTA